MTKTLAFGAEPFGDGRVYTALVEFSATAPYTSCRVSLRPHPNSTGPQIPLGTLWIGSGSTKLGKGDKWDTNAGYRIAFERALRVIETHGSEIKLVPAFARELRRAVQIELAIDRVDRKGKSLDAALDRAAREMLSLLAMKRNHYQPVEHRRNGFVIEPIRFVIYTPKPKLAPKKPKGEPIQKPEAYKNVNEHSIFGFPVRYVDGLIPKGFPCRLDFGPDKGDVPQADGDGGPNQTGR